MSQGSVSAESHRFANQAISEALIGTLRMSAEEGNSSVFQIEYDDGGKTALSPYGVYQQDDRDRITLFTGIPGQETTEIAKASIVAIKLIRAEEIVRYLNALGPWLYWSRMGQATVAYLFESYGQLSRAFTALQGTSL